MLTSNINLFHQCSVKTEAGRKERDYIDNLLRGMLDDIGVEKNLSSTILQKELGRDYKSKIREYGFVRSSEYVPGTKSYGYTFIGSVENVSTKEERQLIEKKNKMFSFSSEVKQVLAEMSPKKRMHNQSWMIAAMKCESKNDLILKVDAEREDRETNIISQLSSDIRKYLLVNGCPVVEIDCRSSQPRHTLDVLEITPEEFDGQTEREWINAIYQGNVYQWIAEKTRLPIELVKKGYNAAMNSDLALTHKWGKPEKKVIGQFFRKHLPRVYQRVLETKKRYGKKMIGNLSMGKEAKAMNKVVNQLEQNNHFAVTIYDGLITTAESSAAVNLLTTELKAIWQWAKNIMNETLVKISDLKESLRAEWNKRKEKPAPAAIEETTPKAPQPPIHVGFSIIKELPERDKIKSMVLRNRLYGDESDIWRQFYGYTKAI